MKDQSTRRTVEWGHLILLAVISAVVIAYLLDARGVSLRTNNLLLVQPASILALVFVALVLPQVVVRRIADESAAERWAERLKLVRVAALAGAFGAMVFSMERIGFDVATFAFMVVGLWICGERRIWLVLLFAAVFTAGVIYGYQQLVPYPFPLTVL